MSLSNFVDMMIDYPNSKSYANQLFLRLRSLDLLTDDQVALYSKHIDNLENMEYA